MNRRLVLAAVAAAAILILLGPLRPAAAADSAASSAAGTDAAKDYLLKQLGDPNTTETTLMAFRMTGDEALVKVFVAYSRSDEKRLRLLAATALSELKGPDAVAAMLERLHTDPMLAIRAQALALFIQGKFISAPQLQEAIQVDDENIRCLAAGALVEAGKGEAAEAELRKLADSKDPHTVGLARLNLLKLGKADQLEPVRRMMLDPNTDARVLELMLDEICEAKIAAAGAVARQLVDANLPDDMRLHAYKTVAIVCPDGARTIAEAITQSDRTVYRVYLFRMLLKSHDPGSYVQSLTKEADPIGAMARLELAMPQGGPAAAKAAADVAAQGHPIVVSHLLDKIKEQIVKDPNAADIYTPVLLGIVRGVPKQSGALQQEQEVAAWAAMLLSDLGTPAALEGLAALIDQGSMDIRRAAVAGLLKTKNPASVAVAKPLLDSPYDELSVTAALAMARQGNKDALKNLQDILATAHRHRPAIVTMACWYILKLQGQAPAAAEELGKTAK